MSSVQFGRRLSGGASVGGIQFVDCRLACDAGVGGIQFVDCRLACDAGVGGIQFSGWSYNGASVGARVGM
ncbi:hypothetical protein HSB1_24400 [Halogranum salarium B-1]|uniref:Uncharacterized protein n=1 Tax=Halogranum salarium B-1 TaxID=1210908 RepID=J3JF79_9EURY|nr:hypothetical protein HSB1_24400 [Halogranum salarium B-1]